VFEQAFKSIDDGQELPGHGDGQGDPAAALLVGWLRRALSMKR
jgi:hypothetical protein